MSKGKAVWQFSKPIATFALHLLKTEPAMRLRALSLLKIVAQWNYLTLRIALVARKDREMVSTACHDFLMYSGYATLAWTWAQQEAVARQKLRAGGQETAEFYQAKIATSDFYFARLLPRAKAHAASMVKSAKSTMQLPSEHFVFD
jgi:hypothetical protein